MPNIADAFMKSLGLSAETHRGVVERLGRALLRTDEGGHKWRYDADSLLHRLRRAGFAQIQASQCRQGKCGVAAALDNQPRSSVYIEAQKPGGSARWT